MEEFILVLTNLLFQATRTYNTRMIAAEKVWETVSTGVLVKLFWIVSTSLGIKGFIEGDWWLVLLYIVSGTFGDWFGMIYKKNVQ